MQLHHDLFRQWQRLSQRPPILLSGNFRTSGKSDIIGYRYQEDLYAEIGVQSEGARDELAATGQTPGLVTRLFCDGAAIRLPIPRLTGPCRVVNILLYLKYTCADRYSSSQYLLTRDARRYEILA
ncbi:hypothetical protein NMY22_g10089 [Coprinellus aureogranulatus]|nr:hypothetical protein NMY22_g10089 [Coprinellus aureogranulatus]